MCRPPRLCRCRTTCRRAGRRSPPTWRPRSMRCGTRARGLATASWWSARAWSGCWSTALAARLPGAEVTAVDMDAARATLVASLGARFARPEQAPGEADIVFHASATSAGLATAIKCAGFEGTVVEMSWYGDKPVEVELGGAFHSRRLKLVSSQVGQVAASRRPRWDYGRRIGLAMRLLAAARARCAGRRGDRLRGRRPRAAARARPQCPRYWTGPRARHPLSPDLSHSRREPHVRRRGARPHHDRPQPAQSVLRPGAGHARRHLRGRRRLLPRDADEGRTWWSTSARRSTCSARR